MRFFFFYIYICIYTHTWTSYWFLSPGDFKLCNSALGLPSTLMWSALKLQAKVLSKWDYWSVSLSEGSIGGNVHAESLSTGSPAGTSCRRTGVHLLSLCHHNGLNVFGLRLVDVNWSSCPNLPSILVRHMFLLGFDGKFDLMDFPTFWPSNCSGPK